MKKLWIILGCGLFLTACVLPEKNDPFEKLPEEKVETLSGELFPFSVSIATRATHRLEKDGKLQGYLASDIVRLEAFEGREVSVEGVFRSEKMRPIFWVEKISVTSLPKEETNIPRRFRTKNFSFTYPNNWDHTLAPNGTAYFLDKNDTSRKVFFTFSVLEKSEIDKDTSDIDLLIKNFSASRTKEKIAGGKTQETALLFSNNSQKVYKFVYTYTDENFLEQILESFVEGETNIQKAIEKELKKQAAIEEEKLAQLQAEIEAASLESQQEENTGEEAVEKISGFFDKIFEKSEEEKSENNTEDKSATEEKSEKADQNNTKNNTEKISEKAEKPKVNLDEKYKNIIDARAYNYKNTALDLSLKSPYGYWYRHFGRGSETIAEIGFSDQSFSTRNQVKVWFSILGDPNPPSQAVEIINNDGQLVIEAPRNANSIYRITGNPNFRNMMWSVIDSIE